MSTMQLSPSDLAVADRAVDELLAAADPRHTDAAAFRGLRYDRGMAWVHFPNGFGGLGLAPPLPAHVERRLLTAGAPPADVSTFFLHLAGPTIVTHGTTEQKQRFL